MQEFTYQHKDSVRVVPTRAVAAPEGHRIPYRRDIEQAKERLKRGGMAEPLSVTPHLVIDDSDKFDVIKLYAAHELGWPTVIICFEPDP